MRAATAHTRGFGARTSVRCRAARARGGRVVGGRRGVVTWASLLVDLDVRRGGFGKNKRTATAARLGLSGLHVAELDRQVRERRASVRGGARALELDRFYELLRAEVHDERPREARERLLPCDIGA